MLSAILGVVLQVLNRASFLFFVQLKLSYIEVKATRFITVSVKVKLLSEHACFLVS